MTRRNKIWLVVAVIFTLLNIGGAGYAAIEKEWIHTCIHAALAFAGEYVIWRLTLGRTVRT